MKIKILISLFLIIITIGAVSAGENATDDSVDINSMNDTPNTDIVTSEDTPEKADLNIEFDIENEIVKDEFLKISYSYYYPIAYENLSCYIDGEYESVIQTNSHEYFYLDLKNYTEGNHTCKLNYHEIDYYKPINKTFNFEIVNMSIVYNEIIYYDFEDFEVKTPYDATGTITITYNGSSKRYNVDDIDSAYGGAKTVTYRLNELAEDEEYLELGTYTFEINYTGNYGNITKRINITKDYYFGLYIGFVYENLTEYINYHGFVFFMGVSNRVSVFIDGKNINYNPKDYYDPGNYNRGLNEYDGMLFDCAPIWINKLSLSKGYHTLEVKYAGNDGLPPKTIKEVFYLEKDQLAKCEEPLVNSKYPIDFIFPENTTGKITAYTSHDGKKYTFFDCKKITNNNAKINIPCTEAGKTYVKVVYNTNNGNGKATTSFKVVPAKVECYEWIGLDPYEKETFTLKSGDKVKGTFSIYVNKKLYKSVKITKKTTRITVPYIFEKAGKYVIKAVWKTNYGTGQKKTRTITIPHFATLKTVKVKKSAKKLTIQASIKKNGYTPIKNKKVTFKFNGKTYKTKTNSKGIAKVTIPKSVLTKLKVGKKITYQVTYLKDTVKKTVKVQR
ncbi:MAG: hypothetical protein E7Z81_03195 [Methanobrevibacter sp.]|uniref:hypothetical protein n=1 Tax=Methanobrevibacter sp. TaxID=66852 RepID=UPI0025E645BD|nr:hypothetical protein [Methanobrevibacter sp.]MBE6497273.1 hypothetical protein [Methanobrevibacter sp.]